MLSKNEIKDIQSLGLKKGREALGRFVAEGPKVVSELAAAIPQRLVALYALPAWLQEHAREHPGAKLAEVDEILLRRLSQLATPHAVVGVFEQLPPPPPPAGGFVLYLDAIQDPGNLGTLIRIADWFGIRSIVAANGTADRYNPKVVQATMASLARVDVHYDENDNWLREQKLPTFAAVLDGEPVYGIAPVNEGVLLVGNESRGLRPGLAAAATHRVTIPKRGEAESLNAAVATGILLSHLLR